MKNKNTFKPGIKSGLVMVAIVFLTACESLTENPKGIPSPTTFYKSVPQAEAALAGSMNQLWGYYVNSYSNQVNGAAYWQYDDQYDGGDLNIPVTHANDLWRSHYTALLNVNGLLSAVKGGSLNAEATPDEIAVVVAQAKFLRAFNYFMLVRMYGDLPLITEDTPDPVNNPIKTRTPVAQVYDLIVSDLLTAIASLPKQSELDASAPGLPTSGAAQSLLAKVYLTMATAPLNDATNYQKAADMAKAVIDGGEYSLIHNIGDVFLQSNKYASEMIFSFHSTVDDPETDPNGGVPDEQGGYGGELVAVTFDTTFAKQPRKEAYLLDYQIFDGDTLFYPDFDTQAPYIRKLYNPPYVTQDEISSYVSYANLPIIRYADVLMIYAEASNRAAGNPTAAGVAALNQVIDRANGYVPNATDPLATTALTMAQFEDKVLQERSWELCFEMGDRWFDIVRKRILDKVTNPIYLPNFSQDDYLFPIPAFDATALGSQNAGY